MKEKIRIEAFSNGITIVALPEDGKPEKKVATEMQREKEIGNTLWESIKNVMAKELTDEVTLNIEYTTDGN